MTGTSFNKFTFMKEFGREFNEFANSTTAHGSSRVTPGRPVGHRVFWGFLLVFANLLCLYNIYTLAIYYLSFPITTSTSFQTAKFQFPDVTVCNMMPFSMRKLERKDPGLATIRALDPQMEHYEEKLEELMKGTEHDKYSLILKCKFNNQACGPDNFTVIQDPVFKTCFTFSAQEELTTNNVRYGLNLLIYAENWHSHLMPEIGYKENSQWESSGIRMVIHQRNTRPYPNIRGISVQPGTSNKFTLEMKKLNLYNVYRKGVARCDDDQKHAEHCILDSYERGRRYEETAEDCYNEVVQDMALQNCKCFMTDYAIPRRFCENRPINSSKDFCDIHNECYQKLKEQLRLHFDVLVVQNCTMPCKQTLYKYTISPSFWPSALSKKEIIEYTRTLHGDLVTAGHKSVFDEVANATEKVLEDFDFVEKNFLKLVMFGYSMLSDEVTEEPAYPFASFISGIGGVRGLFLGASVITLLEPLEFIAKIILIIHSFRKLRQRDVHRTIEDVESNATL